jgi:tripartite-type tricarboxylate transporter receptor subunit TctC
MRVRLFAGLIALAGALASAPLAAQDAWPSKPVRIVVPQSPGGSIDTSLRIVTLKLSEALKQSVVIDNRPGAGTINGTEIVARATPDGYTLLAVASSFTITPSLYAKLSYDPARDFTAVAQISKYPYMLFAHPALPVQSLKEVIALARAKPGYLNYASAGLGTGTHVCMELLRQMAGIDIVHVPYKGGGPAAIATMGGQVQLLAGTTIATLAHARTGKLKAIAVTSLKRTPSAPEVPTFAESGVPGYEYETWNGLVAPARTPSAIIDRLNRHIARVAELAEVKRAFANDGAETVAASPDAFAALMKSEAAKWGKVIRTAGIKPL